MFHTFGSSFFPVLFPVIFALILGMVIFVFISAFRQMGQNRRSPVLTVDAFVDSKRKSESFRHAQNDMVSFTDTDYYVTFEVESGDRMEFRVPLDVYTGITEGEYGKVTFRGTEFLSFERIS